jgi:glycosyltransferase involved in cell wall biosynthesis
MRILLMSQWFPPEPRDLFLQLAQGLKNAGHDVTVLTGFPNWPGGKVYPGYRIRLIQRETVGGVPVVRLPLYPDHGSKAWKRALNLSSLAFIAALLGPFVLRKADLIYVIQLPTHVAAARWLCLFWRSRIVMEVQDLWPESLVTTGMAGQGTAISLLGKWCGWAYRQCSLIRVISPGFAKNLIGKGVPPEKLRMVPNWINSSDFPSPTPDPAWLKKLGTEGKFTLLYAGSIGRPQGLEVVVEAAEHLRDRPDIQILLAGDGVSREGIMEQVASRGLSSVKYLGKFDQADMPQVYAAVDAHLVHLLPDPLFSVTVPSKIVACMASGKPILAGVEGDPLDVILDSGAGIGFEPGSGERLAKALRSLADLPFEERQAMGERGRKAAREKYDSSRLLPKMAALAEEAIR